MTEKPTIGDVWVVCAHSLAYECDLDSQQLFLSREEAESKAAVLNAAKKYPFYSDYQAMKLSEAIENSVESGRSEYEYVD